MTDRWFSERGARSSSRARRWTARSRRSTPAKLDEARRLLLEMKHEWQMLHDLMASGVLDLVSFIQQRLGDEGVEEAWTESMGRGWRRHHDAIVALDRRELVELLAATWRAHSCSGVGPNPGSFTITEDEEKVTLHDEPVRLRPAARSQRRLRGPARRRRHARGARLVLRAQGLPALLHALQLHERVAADPVVGLPAVSLRAARGLLEAIRAPGTGTRIPTRSRSATGSRYGADKPGGGAPRRQA